MLTRIYRWLHRFASKPWQRGQYSGGYWQDKVRKETLVLCRDYSGRVLEVGCGEGLLLTELSRHNPELEIWGVDNDNSRLNLAEVEFREENLKNINLSRQNASNLSFKDERFDAVICVNMLFNLNSLDSVKTVLRQMERVCKKSGRIIFDFRNAQNPLLRAKYNLARYYDTTVKDLPLRTYRPEQIKELLEDLNLCIIRRRFIGFPLRRFAPIVLIEAKKRC